MMVAVVSPSGRVAYRDSSDHFETALLRLMNLDREAFHRWLELAEESEAADLLDRLREGWEQLRPAPSRAASAGPLAPGPRGLTGRVWHAAIAESPSHGVAVSDDAAHGWLVRWTGSEFARECDPPAYEEEYFEGDKLRAGGYGDYTAQAGWRLEKSARQVREMRERTGLLSGRVLDIGSGYGFFRVALGEAGYDHDGLEVSEFARSVASASYGFPTHGGTLDEHWQDWESRFDAVTLFDLIEHLEDPVRFLEQVAHLLRAGGVVGVKTPNIDCPEADVFGAHYHSLKREHLQFFSVTSLTAAARAAGLEPVHVTTSSHLLVGFVGAEQTQRWEQSDRGADIVAWYRRPAAAERA
jgi:2-polyprenyl-3-methyl-5-hydroxy-6-metoxy-1,4-benzoquinol methylase